MKLKPYVEYLRMAKEKVDDCLAPTKEKLNLLLLLCEEEN